MVRGDLILKMRKVKICLEIEERLFGTEMEILSVDPPAEKLPEGFKDKIREDWGINIDYSD